MSRLSQERSRIKFLVNESPTIATIKSKSHAKIPDGIGGEVEDPFAQKVERTVKFRLAHSTQTVPEVNAVDGGTFTTDYNRIATWAYDVQISAGDTFIDVDIGRQFRFGRVDVLRKFGGIVGYQSTIIESHNQIN